MLNMEPCIANLQSHHCWHFHFNAGLT